jgi:hypothetical protein
MAEQPKPARPAFRKVGVPALPRYSAPKIENFVPLKELLGQTLIIKSADGPIHTKEGPALLINVIRDPQSGEIHQTFTSYSGPLGSQVRDAISAIKMAAESKGEQFEGFLAKFDTRISATNREYHVLAEPDADDVDSDVPF